MDAYFFILLPPSWGRAASLAAARPVCHQGIRPPRALSREVGAFLPIGHQRGALGGQFAPGDDRGAEGCPNRAPPFLSACHPAALPPKKRADTAPSFLYKQSIPQRAPPPFLQPAGNILEGVHDLFKGSKKLPIPVCRFLSILSFFPPPLSSSPSNCPKPGRPFCPFFRRQRPRRRETSTPSPPIWALLPVKAPPILHLPPLPTKSSPLFWPFCQWIFRPKGRTMGSKRTQRGEKRREPP